MTFLTSIIIGLCMGSGILFSMYFGAKKYEKMKISFFVSFVSIGILSVVLEIICFLLLKYILVWLQIPQVIYNQTAKYLQIIFIGIIFTFIYNYFAAMLRALGPLIFLSIATIVNVALDIIFVLYVHLGVAGAAYATIIFQAISAIGLAFYVILLKKEILPQKTLYF